MAGIEVGSAYVSIYPNTSAFEEKLAKALNAVDVDSAGKNVGKKASKGFESGFSAVTVAIGNILSEAFMGAADFLGQSLDKGIARLDTIQNFPKVMQAFGFSAEEAAASVQQVSDHLVGLPGSTDEVLRLVQAISDSTGSLELATTTGMAFNDILTASGADAASATLAMRTFDQIMGGGTITAQRWASLTSKMPLQMNMIAESLLGAGASGQELGEALENGNVSLQDFAQTMTDLAPEFETQARAMSEGVGTAITNVGNRVAKGWEEILGAIGQAEISGAINGFSNAVMEGMKVAAGGVSWLKDRIMESGIPDAIGSIAEQVMTWFANIDPAPIQAFAQAVIDFVSGALEWIAANGDTVGKIIEQIAGIIAGIWASGVILNISGAVSALFAIIAANPIAALIIAVAAVADAFYVWFTTTEEGQAALEELKEAFEIVSGAIMDALSVAGKAVEGFINGVVKFFEDLPYKMKQYNNVVQKAVIFAWEKLKEKVREKAEAVRKTLEFVWNKIKDKVASIVGGIVKAVAEKFNAIKDAASRIFHAVANTVSSTWTGIKNTVATVVNAISTTVSNVWNGIKNAITTVINAIKTFIGSAFNGIKTTVSNTTNGVKTTVSSIWNGIKTAISNVVNAIKDTIKRVFNGVKDTVKNIFGGIKDTAANIWGAITGIITGKADDAASGVATATGKMQKSINGVSGKTVTITAKSDVQKSVDAAKRALSSIPYKTTKYIELNAYQSGIRGIDVVSSTSNGLTRLRVNPVHMTMAAGGIVNAATFALVGEAGSEAVIPLSNRQKVRPFAQAVAAEMGGGGGVTVTGNTFYVRNDGDINRIAYALNNQISRQRAGKL